MRIAEEYGRPYLDQHWEEEKIKFNLTVKRAQKEYERDETDSDLFTRVCRVVGFVSYEMAFIAAKVLGIHEQSTAVEQWLAWHGSGCWLIRRRSRCCGRR
jgi:hypothetical protein